MNKLFSLLALSLFIVVFSSCTKEDTEDSHSVENVSTGKIGLTALGPMDEPTFDEVNSNFRAAAMRMLYCEWGFVWENGTITWGIVWCDCYSLTKDCLPTFTVSANANAYENFVTNFNNETLSDYFSTDDYQNIFPGLDDLGVVDELQSGDIKLHYDSDIQIDGKDFYIGLPKDIEYSSSDTSWMSQTKCVLVVDNDL
tara:strand:- start:3263 stop:3856 length:594 start_codon:yes stop_codon:yes gene_type:complete